MTTVWIPRKHLPSWAEVAAAYNPGAWEAESGDPWASWLADVGELWVP